MSQFETEQDYRYEQLRRKNKERGLAEFRKFNTMSAIDPNYTQSHEGVVVPGARGINEMAADYDKKQTEIDAANQNHFQSWCIGDRVLRTETAPVVALSILNYHFSTK